MQSIIIITIILIANICAQSTDKELDIASSEKSTPLSLLALIPEGIDEGTQKIISEAKEQVKESNLAHLKLQNTIEGTVALHQIIMSSLEKKKKELEKAIKQKTVELSTIDKDAKKTHYNNVHKTILSLQRELEKINESIEKQKAKSKEYKESSDNCLQKLEDSMHERDDTIKTIKNKFDEFVKLKGLDASQDNQ